ncbi:MAG: hypothetical protein GTO02_18670 [Candidatus Dadabacteria bacterium]|nr:hypothetical protein [Candidatus Dadabacteria bacterium]
MGISRWKKCKLENKCFDCLQPALEGYVYCEEHLLRKKERNLKRRSRVCDGCGGPKEIAGYCKSCWKKRDEKRRKRVEAKKLRGECTTCANKVAKGRLRCEVCLEKSRKQRHLRESYRRENNLCLHCNKNVEENAVMCCMCHAKDVSGFHFKTVSRASELIEIFEEQGGVCPYTGKKLTIGVNASLDHVVSKHSGGTDDRENLQWVYKGDFDINWMKGALTSDEFINAIYIIYEHLSRSK